MGLVLCKWDIIYWLGVITIFVAITIGVIYGALGVVGILKNMEMIEIKKTTISLNGFFKIFKKRK